MRKPPLALLAFLLAGCGEDAGISGVWAGASVTGIIFTLTLAETPQGSVTGAGTVFNGISNLPVNAIGAHAHPSLALTIDFPRVNFTPISFQGTFNGAFTSVKGVLNGSGFLRDTLLLNRMSPSPSARLTAP